MTPTARPARSQQTTGDPTDDFPPRADIEITIATPHGPKIVPAIAASLKGEWAANEHDGLWFISHRATGFRVPRLSFYDSGMAIIAAMLFDSAGPWTDLSLADTHTVAAIPNSTKRKANALIDFILTGAES